MPGRDGSGPMGQGGMTGRGLGACTGVNATPVGYYGSRRGVGLGMRCGAGLRRGAGQYYYNQPVDNRTQKEILENQKQAITNQLENINKQLDDM